MLDHSRRSVFVFAAALPVLLLGLGGRGHAAGPICFDPDKLSASEKGMRREIGFKPKSSDPVKRCGTCTFFAATAGACGSCQLLSGGGVAAESVCDSWAKKSG